ncbi:MAG: DUF484 family protein [Pseudohongiellaceae bacterium]
MKALNYENGEQQPMSKKKQKARSAALTAKQVTEYLKQHPDFFVGQDDLLAELSLPHDDHGDAISLLERQVTVLRGRSMEARDKLHNLLTNARTNDQLFDITANLVLALVHAEDVPAIVNTTKQQLFGQANIDACEILIAENVGGIISAADLKADYSEVFRLKHTHCGPLAEDKLATLFPNNSDIRSTALCPVSTDTNHDNPLALIALGNTEANYFNINLDTLFLDFIGRLVGAALSKHIA